MPDTPEIVIVGAGISGGALATALVRSGRTVLLLEKTVVHRDRVRGEIMVPWGVDEAGQLGVLDDLLEAGAHFVRFNVPYNEGVSPEAARARTLSLGEIIPGVAEALAFGHPQACDALNESAKRAGCGMIRGITGLKVTPGAPPTIEFVANGRAQSLMPRLVVGADGRGSVVARQIGIRVESDPTHHILAGLLVDDVHPWPDSDMTSGNENGIMYYVFPQGMGRIRLYLGYPVEQRGRFVGGNGVRNFLAAFNLTSLPHADAFCEATPAGPCHGYPNADVWADIPAAPGVVLIGDAAGANDPTIGQGLSIAMRDARLVRDVLLEGTRGLSDDFTPYIRERTERMRRLRFTARLISTFREFTGAARMRRQRAQERIAADPSIGLPFKTYLRGAHNMPKEAFEPEAWHRILS